MNNVTTSQQPTTAAKGTMGLGECAGVPNPVAAYTVIFP